MKNLDSEMTRDIDIKTADSKDLVTWFNENSGSKAIAKFKDRATAESRCAELKQALLEMSGEKAAPTKKGKAAKSALAPAKEKASKGVKGDPKKPKTDGGGRVSKYEGKTIYALIKENKRAASSKGMDKGGAKEFQAILNAGKAGLPYADYAKVSKGINKHLAWDVKMGWAKVE